MTTHTPDPIHPASGDLLPCPFCGDDDPEITGERGWVWVACTTGSDCAGRGPDSEDEAAAIAAWNTRAAPSAPAPSQGAGIGRNDLIRAMATAFVSEQSQGEWGEEMIQRDAAKLTDRILALLEPRP